MTKKVELHLSTEMYCEVGEESSGKPEKWANMEIPPHIADVPEELLARYHGVIREFWDVQAALRKLYDESPPADAVRIKGL